MIGTMKKNTLNWSRILNVKTRVNHTCETADIILF